MSDKPKILVVDDDPDTLSLLSKRLKESGFNVVSAADGVACMAVVRKENPDLIVLDLGLPAGDGFITLDRLQNNMNYAGIPVVVLTAREASECKDRSLAAGASAFFEKTAGKEEFLSAVWRLTSTNDIPTV